MAAVVMAHGGPLELIRSKHSKAGKSVYSPLTLEVYEKADMVIRDFRRTGATRWDDAKLPWHRRQYLLGHTSTLGQTGTYSLQEIENLKADLADTVWAAENAGKWRIAQ